MDENSLREQIEKLFNNEELKDLCQCVGIDYDDLAGETKSAKVRELIAHCLRRGLYPQLIQCCRDARPHAVWPERPPLMPSAPTPSRSDQKSPFIIWGVIGIVLIAIVVGLIFWLLGQSEKESNIAVRIADENGESIQGASILLFYEGGTRQEYSDSNGSANIQITYDQPKTDVRVIVEANEYQLFEREIIVPDEVEIQTRLQVVDPESGDVIIWVTDEQGNPVTNAQVVLIVNADTFSQISDSNGITKFPLSFPDGEVEAQISVQTSEFEINNQRLTLLPNRVQEVRLNREQNQAEAIGTFPEPENSAPSPTTEPDTNDTVVTDCPSGSNNIRFNNGDFLTCAIDASGETDRFEMNFNAAERYILLITKHSGELSPCMELYAPERACNYFDSKRLDVNAEVDGEYALLIRDFSNAEAGSYTLALERITPPSTSATTLPFGMVTNGQLDAPGSLMQYVFDGSENDNIKLTVTKQSGDISPCLELYAPDGTGETVCNYFDTKTLELTLPVNGQYAVLVRDFDNKAIGDYSLNLQCITGACN